MGRPPPSTHRAPVVVPSCARLWLVLSLCAAVSATGCVRPSPLEEGAFSRTNAALKGQDSGVVDGSAPLDAGAVDGSTPLDTGAIDGSMPLDVGAASDVCSADSSGLCVLPNPQNFPGFQHANKIMKFTMAPETVGCDLTGDGVINNVLGKAVGIYPAINDSFAEAIKDGSLNILFAPDHWNTSNTPFAMTVLEGLIAPSQTSCDPSVTGSCDYLVPATNYESPATPGKLCPAKTAWFSTTISNGQLRAKASQQQLPIALTFVGFLLPIVVERAQLRGSVAVGSTWKSLKDGLLCGVLPEADLHAAIDVIPDIGMDKATIKSLIDGVWAPDVDTDNDGKPDAISLAFQVETAAANVVGCTP